MLRAHNFAKELAGSTPSKHTVYEDEERGCGVEIKGHVRSQPRMKSTTNDILSAEYCNAVFVKYFTIYHSFVLL